MARRRLQGVSALVLCVFGLSAIPSFAQQATPKDVQQPGAGEQVHTGTSSGLDSDARFLNLLANHQFLRLESQLAQLPPEQAQFYRGILANRDNNLKTSIQLLEPLVATVAASGDTSHEKLLRKALAEDYLRSGDLVKAAKAYQALETRLVGHLSADEQDEIELPLKLLPLAQGNPPMTVDAANPFVLQVSRNPIGLTDLPVFVDARPHSWMLDPTAPLNLIARSLAKEAGLTVSAESAIIRTLTGRPIQVHVTVIPRITLGGRITFRNMTAFVYEDADYAFPQVHYQVQGVLGYPALSTLGSITFTADATLEVQPAANPSPAGTRIPPGAGARFYLDGDQMLVALGDAGDERMYVVDAGSQQTYLTSRYFDEHTADFAGEKMELLTPPGAPSKPPDPTYAAETVTLTVGSAAVPFHYIQVLTEPQGSVALDDVYGVLGVDALEQLRAYTFDYRTMRFSVRPE